MEEGTGATSQTGCPMPLLAALQHRLLASALEWCQSGGPAQLDAADPQMAHSAALPYAMERFM